MSGNSGDERDPSPPSTPQPQDQFIEDADNSEDVVEKSKLIKEILEMQATLEGYFSTCIVLVFQIFLI